MDDRDEIPGAATRRAFLGTAALLGAAFAAPLAAAGQQEAQADLPAPSGPADRLAADEAHWARVASFYPVTDRVTNLEAGYWGMMATPVMQEFVRQTERVNRENSFYARTTFGKDLGAVRARVARALGCDVSEVALTRGATEALQDLIANYNRLKPGDAVMYADLDYAGMQYAMNWLTGRRGVRVIRIVMPEPATYDNVMETYATALREHPEVRLLLLTHVNNKTGLVTPAADVTALARRQGADVVIDAAHGFGQLDIKAADLGADFIGFNLHKWIGAPVGVGAMYIKRGRLADIDRAYADEDNPPDSITSRVHSGTANFATFLSVPAALDFHDRVGPAYKAARVHYLRNRWVHAVRGVPGIDVLTPDDPRMTAAITSFRLGGRTTKEDNDRIVAELQQRFGLFTVRRSGLERGDCVRVTPALYNRAADVDRLVEALKQMASAAV
jgi:selenocysteine lyase/cysteine desulfurase